MFKSNRYLIISSSIGIISIICLMFVYRQIALTTMLDHETRANEAITELLSKAVRPAYLELIDQATEDPARRADGSDQARRDRIVHRLHDEIERLTRGSSLLKVNIHTLDGETVFSTELAQIGDNRRGDAGFESARAGEAVSLVSFRNQFDTLRTVYNNVNVVTSYIPVIDQPDGEPEAVFEVYSDVTDLIARMQRTQWQIVIGVLGSILMLYLLLLYNARRLDRIQADRLEESARNEAQIRYQASHDALTGLHNRHEFERGAERLIESTQKNRGEHALCFMDLDQFKIVNDTCGHIAGDELLRQLSEVLRGAVRSTDTLARLGGDEFGILMENCTLEHARRTANVLQRSIQKFQFTWEGETFQIGASIGLVAIDHAVLSVNELLKQADAACYMAKDLGRNQIQVYDIDSTHIERRHGEMQWVARINQALEKNRFALYAQAIEPLDKGAGKHYELLVRMISEAGKIIPPGSFLAAAERYDLMQKIDTWVIENAFAMIARNPAFVDQIEFVSINISGQSITSTRFLNSVVRQLQNLDIDASKICFEVTETAAISNLRAATKFIARLKKLGCHFALDDFGSGLSSFGYLKNLPVDYLKIDGVFVKDIADDPIDHAMVKSINDIGHVMGMKTIAEFVESDEIRSRLRDLQVDFVQGFDIGRPRPFEELLDLPAQERVDRAG